MSDGPGREKDTAEDSNEAKWPDESSRALTGFPVVGIGASAGGLEAFKEFLRGIPSDSGVAFVLVQHLDPNHQSLMAELLGRHAKLPVIEAEDGMTLQPDHVYMIPPKKFLRIADSGLFLDEPTHRRGMRMPIDYFFRSLADAQGEAAICIVLSGTGSDGTLGMKDIKAAGGMAIVQKPDTAEYDGMPRSALSTGMADYVLPIGEMPDALFDYIRHPYLRPSTTDQSISQRAPETFRGIVNLLRAHTDYDFRCYKPGTLDRRIHRRMSLRQIHEARDYLHLLREDREELQLLFKDLLIGVTRFFRDVEVWEALRNDVIAPLVEAKRFDEPIRVWVVGCATGEEAYSLAMLIYEEMDSQRKTLPIQIYATDLDPDAIDLARAGWYPGSIVSDVTPQRLTRFFTEDGDGYKVGKRLRESVVFAPQNVVSDPPFSRLDLVSCRNLLIYLESHVQSRLMDMFHFALNEGGALFLGTSESVNQAKKEFEPISKTYRLYRRVGPHQAGKGTFPIVPGPATDHRRPKKPAKPYADFGEGARAETAKRVLLEHFAPAAVLVNRQFEVQYFHGPVRQYLDYPTGEPATDLTALALHGLKSKLRGTMMRALHDNATAEDVAHGVKRDEARVSVRIRVQPIAYQGEDSPLLLISFVDEAPPTAEPEGEPSVPQSEEERSALNQLEYELQATREDLQSTIEEVETANEELKASNEEVMSMNEELQSTNEELETSREELQSLNEELTTVNNQLEDKVQELESTNNDLSNLLISTDIATLFLDTDLNIRRFTPAASDLMRLREGDVGRPIGDLAPRLEDPDLLTDAKTVLRRLQPIEANVLHENGQAFLRRILPYRTSENKIDGVVVTFADVTNLKETAAKLEEREGQQRTIAEIGRAALGGATQLDLLATVVDRISDQLGCPLVDVLELGQDDRELVLRSGKGWAKDEIGAATLPTGLESFAGYTLNQGSPVIAPDFDREKRFNVPDLLRRHDAKSGINVLIGRPNSPWGVLGAYSRDAREFTMDDVSFLQAVANVLGDAIEKEQITTRLQLALQAGRMGIWEWNPATDEAIWDDRLRELIDAAPDDPASGKTFFERIYPDDVETVRNAAQAALAEGSTYHADFRVQHKDGTIRWISGTGVTVDRGHGDERMIGINSDITEDVHARERLSESEERYRLALEATETGTWEWRVGEDSMIWDERQCEIFGIPPQDTVALSEIDARVADGDAARRKTLLSEAVENEIPYHCEFRVQVDDHHVRWVRETGRVFGSDKGQRILGTTQDITQARQAMERDAVLVAELDHRVKNLLANIKAVARQSARGKSSIDDFIKALDGRLMTLANIHSLLSSLKWSGVGLGDLLTTILGPFVSPGHERLKLEGPSVTLQPDAAQSMALVIHELTTNAVKYGALSSDDGVISITWSRDQENGGGEFHLTWTETGGPEVEPPEDKSFGLTVIENLMSSDLEASVEIDFRSSGLVWTFAAPLDRVIAPLAAQVRQSVREDGVEAQQVGDPLIELVDPLRILVVEDVWAVASELKQTLEGLGHEVVGPAATLDEAMALAKMNGIDAALLDVQLRDERVFPLSDLLIDSGTPFAFTTGFTDPEILPEHLRDVPRVPKPYTEHALQSCLRVLVASGEAGS